MEHRAGRRKLRYQMVHPRACADFLKVFDRLLRLREARIVFFMELVAVRCELRACTWSS